MSLKNKVGLPVPEECDLYQAILWLASGELPIETSEQMIVFGRSPLDQSTHGEAMEALLLALRSGRLPATGMFWENDPKAYPRQKIMKIEPTFWTLDRIDWGSNELKFPAWSQGPDGSFDTISIPTKDLFGIFSSDDAKRSYNRPGRKREYDWDSFYVEIAVRADLDSLPETAAELQRDMAEWCQVTWGEEPGETSLKGKIAPIYKHPRKTQGR